VQSASGEMQFHRLNWTLTSTGSQHTFNARVIAKSGNTPAITISGFLASVGAMNLSINKRFQEEFALDGLEMDSF